MRKLLDSRAIPRQSQLKKQPFFREIEISVATKKRPILTNGRVGDQLRQLVQVVNVEYISDIFAVIATVEAFRQELMVRSSYYFRRTSQRARR